MPYSILSNDVVEAAVLPVFIYASQDHPYVFTTDEDSCSVAKINPLPTWLVFSAKLFKQKLYADEPSDHVAY